MHFHADQQGQRLPYLDYLVVRFIKSATTAPVLFANGKLDSVGLSATDVPWVAPSADEQLFTIYERGPSPSISILWFNQHTGTGPQGEPYLPEHKRRWFTDAAFRRAVLYGFNRQGLVEGVYFGQATVLDSVISPGNPKWHNPDTRKYRYNPDKARAILAEAGYSWNEAGVLLGP